MFFRRSDNVQLEMGSNHYYFELDQTKRASVLLDSMQVVAMEFYLDIFSIFQH